MPGACLNSFQTDACEWSIGYVWRSSDWVERGLFIALAVMLSYTVLVLIRFSRRCYLARHESPAFVRDFCTVQRSLRTFVADLSRGLRTLKAIASTAPFLGLAGTSYWILGGLFFGYSGSPTRYFDLIEARTASSLLTAATAILVAIQAILVHNVLRMRIDRYERKFSRAVPAGVASHEDTASPQQFRLAQTLPLQEPFSRLPPFALIAAPALASIVAIVMTVGPYETPTGLHVGLIQDRCVDDGDDRLIILRLTDAGELFINETREPWNSLPEVLSKIYGSRLHRTLYVRADDGVPFQTVADAIDIVENATVEPHQAVRMGGDSLDITVLLITPKAMNTTCVLEPVAVGSSQHDSR
jgi:biopolymer transport protein ExbD